MNIKTTSAIRNCNVCKNGLNIASEVALQFLLRELYSSPVFIC